LIRVLGYDAFTSAACRHLGREPEAFATSDFVMGALCRDELDVVALRAWLLSLVADDDAVSPATCDVERISIGDLYRRYVTTTISRDI
jgi:hypothetical protein